MAAGCILVLDRHLVDSGHLARLERSFPYHMLRLGISFRLGPLEMAAPAGHQGMQIIGHLLVVVCDVALAAVPVNVLAVAGLCGLRMTDNAGDLWVGRLGIFCRVDKGNLFPREDLRGGPELSMTVEADRLDLFGCLALLRIKSR